MYIYKKREAIVVYCPFWMKNWRFSCLGQYDNAFVLLCILQLFAIKFTTKIVYKCGDLQTLFVFVSVLPASLPLRRSQRLGGLAVGLRFPFHPIRSV